MNSPPGAHARGGRDNHAAREHPRRPRTSSRAPPPARAVCIGGEPGSRARSDLLDNEHAPRDVIVDAPRSSPTGRALTAVRHLG